MTDQGQSGGNNAERDTDGTVTITNAEGQTARTGKTAEEIIASLNRNTENATQSVGKIFDAEKTKVFGRVFVEETIASERDQSVI
ncbi:hypothetical protein D3C81_1439040 [compost metagenome]|uniref:Uncharacterized protein n=1 Tax=Cupriavidus campinensis TaxID=151783 RepID=A0ABY3EPJ2_9BURK|nr:hypothetical protein [Cupriavidus campinensis]TSP12784.1 hypothetical protein FGG12_11305 [Cupriavidus campinensis]